MTYYFVQIGEEKIPSGRIVLVPGENLSLGSKDFIKYFGELTTLEQDLLLIASAVFAADRATRRGEREDVCRSIMLEIPVVNYERIARHISTMQSSLRLLSNDTWRIVLRQSKGTTETFEAPKSNGGTTLLLSGGLDSFAAAIQEGDKKVTLEMVSHRTHNPRTSQAQTNLYQLLSSAGYNVVHKHFFVSSGAGKTHMLEHDEESSQRTRSFLFMILGALVARRTGNHKILMLAENGQLAIHLPLTQGRIGAFSTHTAHPDVISSMEDLLSSLMQVKLIIRNPFAHMTKKEVVEIAYTKLRKGIPISTSCFMNWRLPASFTHCGTCIPCYIRRIAIESLGKDHTKYARNVWIEHIGALPEDDDGRRNLMDLLEFITFFGHSNEEEIMNEYPELYSPNLNSHATIDMYRRFCKEAIKVFTKYPAIKEYLNANKS
jgi:7-cyano-7-deazaguanine synthase in queuosine biosynthesis